MRKNPIVCALSIRPSVPLLLFRGLIDLARLWRGSVISGVTREGSITNTIYCLLRYWNLYFLSIWRKQCFRVKIGPRHGSLEAIVGRTKLSKKTKIGDGSGMSCLLLPLTKFSKVCVFSASVNFKGFFDRYLAVKSHLRVLKFFVEFIKVSKTGFESKIRTSWAEILAFFWDKVRRNSISLTIEDFKTRIYWKFGHFWKACIVTFQ